MSSTAAKRPSIRLNEDETWAVLADAHTGILTTLRRDGVPISLPVWFAAIDRLIYVTTPARTKKVARVRHDSRSSFLVESGLRWAELLGVHMTGRVELVDAEAETELARRVAAETDRKYAAFRTARSAMPKETRAHYAGSELIRFTPDARVLTWDNSRLGVDRGGA